MSRILVVEDQPNLLRSVTQALSEAGFESQAAACLQEAQSALQSSVDLIILDVMLPDGSGLDWLRSLRQNGNRTLVLMLTARDSVDDRITGLETGADDYMVKPFGTRELLARIRAALRHIGHVTGPNEPFLKAGTLEIDLLRREVRRNGALVKLSPREFTLLRHLALNADQVLTHQMILREVWGVAHLNDTQIGRASCRERV